MAADKASSVAVPVSVLATLTMPRAVDEARGNLWLWVLLTATLSLVSVRSAGCPREMVRLAASVPPPVRPALR